MIYLLAAAITLAVCHLLAAAITLAVCLVPIVLLGSVVVAQGFARQQGWRAVQGRKGTWYWRVWWWYGYHGLYQIDRRLKERCAARASDETS